MKNLTLGRRLAVVSAMTALAVTGAGAAPAFAAPAPSSDAPVSTGLDRSSAIVRLSADPLATSTKAAHKNGKVDQAAPATRSAKAELSQQRNALRAWLKQNAPQAKITGEYDFALNAVAVRLNGTSLETLRKAPGVVSASYQGTYTPTADDPDLALINALQGWSAAGAASVDGDPSTWAGFGVKVGIVDTGIDATHPCFSDAGYPAAARSGDPRFTNNKVVVAKVFNNKINQGKFSAEALQDHGTHVAGTVACNLETPATVEGADIPYDPSGVAPGALLGNYNVFPGGVQNARSEDIANALEAAAEDGMDVINMSLGGGASGIQDLLTMAVDNLDRAGIVVAVSAGNEGPGARTGGSPGTAERALTAGASSVGHYVGIPISSGGSQVSVGAIGDFPTPTSDITAPLGVVLDGSALSTACSALPAGSLAGKIALISRGGCTFGQKIQMAENAGALAAVVVNNAAGDPSAMGGDGVNNPTIPAVMAPLADRAALMALDGATVTLGSQKAYARTGNDNLLMSFSSWGPTDVDFRVKPDVVAPGGNVLSSVPMANCDPAVDPNGCWAFLSGTSMAAPHLAGMAAVVRDAHPAWDAWQVRSAIINTADVDGVLTFRDGAKVPLLDVQQVGNGLAQLDDAVGATLVLDRPSISFGAVPKGAGQTLTQTFQVTNVSAGTITLDLTVKGDAAFTASAADAELAPGESTTVTVTLALPRGSDAGNVQAHLVLDGHTHMVLFAYAK